MKNLIMKIRTEDLIISSILLNSASILMIGLAIYIN